MSKNFNSEDLIKAAIRKAFEPVANGDERLIAEDSQMIDGIWHNPVWGCDTMQHFIDALRDGIDEWFPDDAPNP